MFISVAFNTTSEAAQKYEPLSWLWNQVGFSYSWKVCPRERAEAEEGGVNTLSERPCSRSVLGCISLQQEPTRGAREPVQHIAVWPTWTLQLCALLQLENRTTSTSHIWQLTIHQDNLPFRQGNKRVLWRTFNTLLWSGAMHISVLADWKPQSTTLAFSGF